MPTIAGFFDLARFPKTAWEAVGKQAPHARRFPPNRRRAELANPPAAGLRCTRSISIPRRVPMSTSSNGKYSHGASPPHVGKQMDPQPGDEAIGEWPRERLIRMDNRDFALASCARSRPAPRAARPQ